MCLAVPMKVISCKDGVGIAEMAGVKKEISFMMLPEAEIGDYVIVHAGFAIQILNEEEAQKIPENGETVPEIALRPDPARRSPDPQIERIPPGPDGAVPPDHQSLDADRPYFSGRRRRRACEKR